MANMRVIKTPLAKSTPFVDPLESIMFSPPGTDSKNSLVVPKFYLSTEINMHK